MLVKHHPEGTLLLSIVKVIRDCNERCYDFMSFIKIWIGCGVIKRRLQWNHIFLQLSKPVSIPRQGDISSLEHLLKLKSQLFWKLLETDPMFAVTLIWKPFGIMSQLMYVSNLETKIACILAVRVIIATTAPKLIIP